MMALPAAAKAAMERLMQTGWVYQSDFAKKYYGQGLQEGRQEGLQQGRQSEAVRALLTFIEARGIALGDEERARIEGCADVDQFEAWIRRAAKATRAAQVFADKAPRARSARKPAGRAKRSR